MNEEIKKELEKIVYKQTDNFCYSCYKIVKESHCPTCGSDDLMRHLKGVGVEYGTDWVIEHLLSENLTSADVDDIFEDMINECYDSVKIGWIEFDVAHAIKELDPISWDMAKREYIDSLIEDDQLVECNNQYYHVSDIENYIAESGV